MPIVFGRVHKAKKQLLAIRPRPNVIGFVEFGGRKDLAEPFFRFPDDVLQFFIGLPEENTPPGIAEAANVGSETEQQPIRFRAAARTVDQCFLERARHE